MKLSSINITKLYQSQINIIRRDELYFKSPYHYHPELELVYIKEGFGKRIVGNKIDDFNAGELLLIGSNTPHVWMSDKSFYTPGFAKRSQSIVLYFNPEIFSDHFYKMEESFYLNEILRKAKHGLKITGNAKEEIIKKLEEMVNAKNLNKLIGLLNILNVISTTSNIELITEDNVMLEPITSDRLKNLLEYINLNHKKDITLKEIAKVANLTPESFCRFFKQKTGKKFNDYLQGTRIRFACQSLLNTDMAIAEIAYKTGFKTIPGFNKLFKKSTGNSPTEYRKKAHKNLHDSFYGKHTLQANLS